MSEVVAVRDMNVVIADFMGWEMRHIISSIDGDKIYYFARKGIADNEGNENWGGNSWSWKESDTLPYDWNWNYLQEAVEKIESMGYKVKTCRKRCQICKDEKEEIFFIDVKTESKVKSVHEAVYKFIKSNHNK